MAAAAATATTEKAAATSREGGVDQWPTAAVARLYEIGGGQCPADPTGGCGSRQDGRLPARGWAPRTRDHRNPSPPPADPLGSALGVWPSPVPAPAAGK